MCVAKNVAVSDFTSEVKVNVRGCVKDQRSSEAASIYIRESLRVCVRFIDSETAAAVTIQIASPG